MDKNKQINRLFVCCITLMCVFIIGTACRSSDTRSRNVKSLDVAYRISDNWFIYDSSICNIFQGLQFDQLQSLNCYLKNDTMFILEFSKPETIGDFSATLWNKEDTITILKSKSTNWEIRKGSAFTRYTMILVSQWNLNQIRKEEKQNALIPSNIIYATRIIFNKNRYKADRFNFIDFLNIEQYKLYHFE